MPDIIYPVRPGDVNEELRYSLRSLHANVANVGTVWVIGYQPSWLTGVEYIDGGNATSNGHANVYQNILTAARHKAVSEDVLIFNDDFFVTEPLEEMVTGYRGTLVEHLSLPRLRTSTKSWWRDSLTTTQVCLQALGFKDPLSYELHVPFPAKRSLMAETLERFAEVTPSNPPQWRTLYGNLHPDPQARRMPDSKVFTGGAVRRPFHSTTDLSWKHFKVKLTAMFPTASPYELPPSVARKRA